MTGSGVGEKSRKKHGIVLESNMAAVVATVRAVDSVVAWFRTSRGASQIEANAEFSER